MDHRHRSVERYYRQEHFDFFRRYRSPFYAVTFELEIARLEAWRRARGHSLYANLCYFFTRAMQRVEDFRYRWRDGAIVLYEQLHPGLTVPAPGGRFGFAYLAYDADPERFNAAARRALAAAAERDSLAEAETGHSNFIFFTALPGVPFTAMTHAERGDPLEGEPRVAFGRFRRDGERLVIPVSVQVNHVFIDGAALGALYRELETTFATV